MNLLHRANPDREISEVLDALVRLHNSGAELIKLYLVELRFMQSGKYLTTLKYWRHGSDWPRYLAVGRDSSYIRPEIESYVLYSTWY